MYEVCIHGKLLKIPVAAVIFFLRRINSRSLLTDFIFFHAFLRFKCFSSWIYFWFF